MRREQAFAWENPTTPTTDSFCWRLVHVPERDAQAGLATAGASMKLGGKDGITQVFSSCTILLSSTHATSFSLLSPFNKYFLPNVFMIITEIHAYNSNHGKYGHVQKEK